MLLGLRTGNRLSGAERRVAAIQAQLRAAHRAYRDHYRRLNPIWREVLDTLRYCLDLAPPDVLRLRMHSGLFVGEAPWQYWHTADQYDGDALARQLGYAGLVKDIPRELWLSEAPNRLIPRPMGIRYGERVINSNVARHQNVVTNLFLTGVWDRVFAGGREGPAPGPATVVEIGPGYGGLAAGLFAASARPVHFVAVDFPEILLFCCGYLAAAFDDIELRVIRSAAQLADVPPQRHALLLLPSFSAEWLSALPHIDLAINAASFQEMSTQEVEHYVGLIYPKLRGVLLSDNIDRHHLNTEATLRLSQVFARFGSLFPAADAYDSVVHENKWDWFYSTFLLGPPEVCDGLRRHLRVYFGPMKQGSVMDYREGNFTMTGAD